jgi:Icc protein
MPMKILQLTDLHLFADPTMRLKSVPTRETLSEVLAYIDAHERDIDHIVITGDLTHDEQVETYEGLRAMLGQKCACCQIIPGNHDDRALIRQVFPDLVCEGPGPLTFSLPGGGWQLIGLDSHVPGLLSGCIDASQLEWLRRELEKHRQQPTALFMHHPPVSVGVTWLDSIGLDEPEGFCRLVETSPQVKLIVAGHVHHVFEGRLAQAAVYTTPSTGVQFLPAFDEPVYEALPPGYRIIEFNGDAFQTKVIRLPEVKFPPADE